ncbi:NitT/TauT family transport system ATP-binding protein [Rhizobiales bacterium GAS191]|nr:NitT/TauT family transport system ATP-binding protein [Rhizobiales bacterium GAS191]
MDAKVDARDQERLSRSSATDAISVRRLSLVYGRGQGAVQALQHIDFSVRDGEFVSVVGPSGCGKSTLLKILAGLLPPSEGEADLKGTPIKGPRRDIGVVFQSPVLFPWRSVLGNAAGAPPPRRL